MAVLTNKRWKIVVKKNKKQKYVAIKFEINYWFISFKDINFFETGNFMLKTAKSKLTYSLE